MKLLFRNENRKTNHVSEWWSLIVIISVPLIAFLVTLLIYNLPPAIDDLNPSDDQWSFNSGRAWDDLKKLTDIGPRITGTYANEVLAINFFTETVRDIQREAHPNQSITADVQIASGSIMLSSVPRIYRNVQNFVVELKGTEEDDDQHSFLVNCHFDTAAGSPGASDDGGSCAVMLEILRVLSKQNERQHHTIIFLFNGSEEIDLLGSHAFITQHKWAKRVRAFINIESMGSGGKELLFQTEPNNGWLIDKYQKVVPHPFGQVVGEELFTSGAIPSYTDFRIIVDYGGIPGMDFANIMNGYRYHTRYDSIDYQSKPVLQNTGDNMLALVREISNSDELIEPDKFISEWRVYYDVLGLFFISYTKTVGISLNLVVSLASVIIPIISLSYAAKAEKSEPYTLIHLWTIGQEALVSFIQNIVSVGIGIGVGCLIALELDATDNSMSWYYHTWMIVPVYCIPFIIIQCFGHYLVERNKRTELNLDLTVQSRLVGTNLLWAVLLITITGMDYRSGYLLMIPLLISTVSNLVIGVTCTHNSKFRIWLYIHLFFQIFSVLWTTYLSNLFLNVFMPITGRSVSSSNPDILIAFLSSGLTFLVTSFLTPLVIMLKRRLFILIGGLTFFFIAWFLLVQILWIGFPYHDDILYPTPQRLWISHVSRTLHSPNGTVHYTDSGFWLRETDRHSKRTIDAIVEPYTIVDLPLCEDLFCALPSYRILNFNGYLVHSLPPPITDEAHLVLVNHRNNSNDHYLDFTTTGKYLYSIQVGTKSDVEMISWNISNIEPIPVTYGYNFDRVRYFVMVTNGLEGDPLQFTIHVKTDESGPLIDIAIVTFFIDYPQNNMGFNNILDRVPSWAFVAPSMASLKSYTF